MRDLAKQPVNLATPSLKLRITSQGELPACKLYLRLWQALCREIEMDTFSTKANTRICGL